MVHDEIKETASDFYEKAKEKFKKIREERAIEQERKNVRRAEVETVRKEAFESASKDEALKIARAEGRREAQREYPQSQSTSSKLGGLAQGLARKAVGAPTGFGYGGYGAAFSARSQVQRLPQRNTGFSLYGQASNLSTPARTAPRRAAGRGTVSIKASELSRLRRRAGVRPKGRRVARPVQQNRGSLFNL